jgi:hypothetical protein
VEDGEGWGWGDAGVGLAGVFVEGDEGAGGVEYGLEGGVVVNAAVVVGAGDDVPVGDGCGAEVVCRDEADGGDGEFEVGCLLFGVVALGGGGSVLG